MAFARERIAEITENVAQEESLRGVTEKTRIINIWVALQREDEVKCFPWMLTRSDFTTEDSAFLRDLRMFALSRFSTKNVISRFVSRGENFNLGHDPLIIVAISKELFLTLDKKSVPHTRTCTSST